MKKIIGLVEFFCKISAGRQFTEKNVSDITRQISERFTVLHSSIMVPLRRGQSKLSKVDYENLTRHQAITALAKHLIDNNLVEEEIVPADVVEQAYYLEKRRYKLTVLK